MFLYERYAVAIIKANGKGKADRIGKIKQFESDFGVDNETARAFWDVMRDGLLHSGMPKQAQSRPKLPSWAFRHDFPRPVKLAVEQGQKVLKVQPWLFMNKVLSFWSENLGLLDRSDSFPWGNIYALPF